MYISSVYLFFLVFVIACGSDDSKDQNNQVSYEFSVSASQLILSHTLAVDTENGLRSSNLVESLCTSVLCITPSEVSGKYFGISLGIQSIGHGMDAYFSEDGFSSFSEVNAESSSYDFDLITPIVYEGNLVCCSGSGDLTNENTYFSGVSYSFAYFDITFAIASAQTNNQSLIGQHSLRFIMIDDLLEGTKRGDILVKDADTYKWMNESGTLVSTRPGAPITMNESVVNWEDPYADGSYDPITVPIISAGLAEGNDGPMGTSEEELKAGGTYSFNFNGEDLLIFPTILQTDGAALNDLKTVLEKIHIQGLPYDDTQFSLPDTELSIAVADTLK